MSIHGNSDITAALAAATKDTAHDIDIDTSDVVTEDKTTGANVPHTGANAASKIGSGSVAGGGFAKGNDLAKAEAIAEILSDYQKRVKV